MNAVMSPLESFFHMGGYWPYIWPAYGMAAFLLVGLLVLTIVNLRQANQELAALEALSPRRRRRRAPAETTPEENDHAQP